MTWDELESRAEDVARLSPTYLLLMALAGAISLGTANSGAVAKHLPRSRRDRFVAPENADGSGLPQA